MSPERTHRSTLLFDPIARTVALSRNQRTLLARSPHTMSTLLLVLSYRLRGSPQRRFTTLFPALSCYLAPTPHPSTFCSLMVPERQLVSLITSSQTEGDRTGDHLSSFLFPFSPSPPYFPPSLLFVLNPSLVSPSTTTVVCNFLCLWALTPNNCHSGPTSHPSFHARAGRRANKKHNPALDRSLLEEKKFNEERV